MGLFQSHARHDRRVGQREVVVTRLRHAAWRSAVKVAPKAVPKAAHLLGKLAAFFALGLGASWAQAQVNGLIVELREASPNVPATLKASPERAKALADEARWQALLQDRGLASAVTERRAVGERAQLLRFAAPLDPVQVQALSQALAGDPRVAWVTPNTREQRLQVGPGGGALNPPNDPLFATAQQQWWLQPVSGSNSHPLDMRLRGVPGFQTAWQRHTGQGTVAVLDTGVAAHPELLGRLLPGYDFVSDWDSVTRRGYANDGDGRDADASDPGDEVTDADQRSDPARYANCALQASAWHGTIIAGMLVGLTHNNQGTASMLWGGRVLPVRVAGKCGADVADVVDGIRWAAGLPVAGVPLNPNPARVISMSFGSRNACPAIYAQAIQEIAAAPGGGAILVAAGGNSWSALSRPANCAGAVGVVALNRDGFKANYASFGEQAVVATVGGDDDDGRWGALLADSGLLTLSNTGRAAPEQPSYTRVFGSSFSAPLAAGVAALMLSVNPALSVDQLIEGLRVSARPHVSSPYLGACSESNPGRCACTSATCGQGMLDAAEALNYAANPGGYVKPATSAAVLDHAELRQAASLGADRDPNLSSPAPSSGGGGSWSLFLTLLLFFLAFTLVLRRRPPD